MSKFNENKRSNKLYTYEGGTGYAKNEVNDWLNMLFSSYLEPGYYNDGSQYQKRFIDLTNLVGEKLGYDFVAKAAIYARQELGMRSVSSLLAAMLNSRLDKNKRAFFRRFFYRPDDVAEVFAAAENVLKDRLSHGLIRGAKDYLSSLNGYTLGKYKLNNKQYNMYDLINLTHPKSAAVDKYMNGKLPIPETWETMISASHGNKEKAASWDYLVNHHRLGYLALLRNLNNIFYYVTDQNTINNVLDQLTNKEKIRKSMVFPYQIYTAYKNFNSAYTARLAAALEEAFAVACDNITGISGSNAIILDVSGSMSCSMSINSEIRIKEACAAYAVAIALKNPDIDIIKFGDNAEYFDFSPNESPFEMIDRLCINDDLGYGTNLGAAYRLLDKEYNRIFLLSDMQTYNNILYSYIDNGEKCFKEYREAYNPNCHLYSFDLGNYPAQSEAQENNVHLLTSLNDHLFKFIELVETDPHAIIKHIEDSVSY